MEDRNKSFSSEFNERSSTSKPTSNKKSSSKSLKKYINKDVKNINYLLKNQYNSKNFTWEKHGEKVKIMK